MRVRLQPGPPEKDFDTMERIDDSICSGIEHADERRWAAFYAAFAPVMRDYAVRRGAFRARSAAETVSYMKTQVARQVIDYHRRAKVRCLDATVEFDEFTVPVSADTPRIVEAREEAAIRARAREKASVGWRCSDRTRAIFDACTIGGRSAVDVAREFGVPPGFVRVVRHRGLARERTEGRAVM